jgi:hypothetical protein
MATKAKKLTDSQKRILAELPDDKYKFPGWLEALSCRKLESMGYAESELMIAKRDNTKGITNVRLAYKRTPKGKEAASSD